MTIEASDEEQRPEKPIAVGLSTAAVYPQPTRHAFELAASLGYDGVEIMVWSDPVSQDIAALAALAQEYSLPILSIHAPCLIISQRVWSSSAPIRLNRAVEAAKALEAPTVVVHPPFRWQRRYARGFVEQVVRAEEASGVVVAVENMYPLRVRGRRWSPYAPHWDPTATGYGNYTLDISHASAAQVDSFELAQRMGERLTHVHLGDGTGAARDEHLIPGHGNQPCAQVLSWLGRSGFAGSVIVEVSTRHLASARDGMQRREAALAESLAFARSALQESTSQVEPSARELATAGLP